MNRPRLAIFHVGRFLGAGLLLAAGVLGSGCNTTPAPKFFPMFYMEAPTDTGQEITLPQSGMKARIMPEAFLTGASVTRVEWVQVSSGRPLLFFMDDAGTRQLYAATVGNQGRHIYLLINDKPMGFYWINEGPIENGLLYIWPEVSEADLNGQWLKDLRESIDRIQAMRQKK